MDETKESGAPVSGRGGWKRLNKVLLGAFALLLTLALGAAYVVSEHLAGQVHRQPAVFAGLDETARPPAVERDGLTVLLVGSDSLSDRPTTGTAAVSSNVGSRSDVIMVVRMDYSTGQVAVVSIPRDSWVPIPAHGREKINASYAYGGPSLLVRTVEALTRIRIDHFAAVDFTGFSALTDAVGGIDVQLSAPTSYGTLHLRAGPNHLDGAETLLFVRQRRGLPGGDLDRVRRHQAVLRALFDKVATSGVLTDPARTYSFLDELTRWVTVDESMTNEALIEFAARLHEVAPERMVFLTVPVAGTGTQGGQSVVYLDETRGDRLWLSLADGRLDSYLAQYPCSVLGSVTR